MVLALLTEIIVLYMQITIVEIEILEFENPIKFVSSFAS